jgi:hypothetical protein
MKISEFKISKYHNRLPHWGSIKLGIQELEVDGEPEIIEKYAGAGLVEEGESEVVSEEGYAAWKEGIRRGINYALAKLNSPKAIKVVVLEAVGESSSSNPTIMGFVAARAILSDYENTETPKEKKALDKFVFSSWLFGFDGMPDFYKMKMEPSKARSRKRELPRLSLLDKLKRFFREQK